MFIKDINDNDLIKIIYKAGSNLFPRYRDLFNGDIEEFQQQCAVLMLDNLKNYNPKISKLSTYIYCNMPLLIGRWLISREGIAKVLNNNTINLDHLMSDTELDNNEKIDNILEDDYNLVEELYRKEDLEKLYKALDTYKIAKMRLIDNLSFSKMAKKLKISLPYARYKYNMELEEIRKLYKNN